MNLAAIWKLPVIFLCENNRYAMSSPQARMCSVTDIATRAISYGMPGVVVDGQDVLAVYQAVSAAVRRARGGDGPSLVEAKTYRYCEHEEGEDVPPYRTEEEKRVWRARDPIEIFVARLRAAESFSLEELAQVRADVQAEVVAAVDFARESSPPPPAALLEDVFI
jgi:TPP-dependent pyruvate/acetoin dehydrogenase alpha subunit